MPKPSKPLIDKTGAVRALTEKDEVSVTATMLQDDFPELAQWSKQRKRGRSPEGVG